jgi:probable HAF family extracellular repeat protein
MLPNETFWSCWIRENAVIIGLSQQSNEVLFVKKIAFLLIFSTFAAADPIYTVASLGGAPSTGYAVNSAGTVAGSAQNASGSQQAFVSTPNGLTILSPNSLESYGYGINNSGTVVGITYSSGVAYGTIWSGSGSTELGAGSYAMAINNAGEVVGANGGQAFTDVNGQVQELATQPGIGWSAAYGVNDSGTVVGDGQLANGTFRGIVWSPNGSMVLLGTLGGTSSQATGVSDNGEVVGFASLADGYQNAFSMMDGLMINLGTLGGNSYAYGVNDSGEAVGYSYLANGNQDAFLYYDGTMLDLNSLIPTNSGWDLLAAYGINDSGQITGVGLYDGQLTAFLLTDPPPPGGPSALDSSAVPEPRMALLLGAILALICLLGRRSYCWLSDSALGAGLATGSRGALPGRG